MRSRVGARVRLIAALAVVAAMASFTVPGPAAARSFPGALRIEVLSGRADLVSGGDALLAVSGVGARPGLRVEVDGRDVTGRFAPAPDGRLVGLVDGLRDGRNEVTARSGVGGARLTVTNHPIGGPLIAGPQLQPWICGTEREGLGPPADAQCNAGAVHSFVYRNAVTQSFEPYRPESPPQDGVIARTTTDRGATVRYIVRVEKGVLDRGIYQTAVLQDPTRGQRAAAWNNKVLMHFDGGATGHYTQDPSPDVLLDHALSRGFLVASSGMMKFGYNTNQVVAAETVMMLKERIIERLGPIRYTIGDGCSGGSLQQQLLAVGYPGLLNGIQPSCSYPDEWTAASQMTDCHLLAGAFERDPGLLGLTPQQRAAIAGHKRASNCESYHKIVSVTLDPSYARGCNLPPSQVYHPQTNPAGVRCSVQDYQRAIWGPRPQDGFAKRPLGNVGVQYGLDAMNSGAITPEQFVRANEAVGGLDIDWRPTPERMRADPGALRTAYRSGQVVDGRRLAEVPIIDLRPYSEVEYHNTVNSYQVRARLDRDNGGHANQLIWRFPAGVPSPYPRLDIAEQSLVLMDAWLAAVERDHGAAPLAVKVARAKPGGAGDTCWIDGRRVDNPARCDAAFPTYASPRIAAGGPWADDVLACRLRPMRPADYRAPLTAVQWRRLAAVFPAGVCDWAAPGVDQQPSLPWMSFAERPGGRPLGPPPGSTPLIDRRRA